jgi:hypothetical protein
VEEMMANRGELCSAHEAAKPAWLIWLPHVLVACWLLYLGVSIWLHVLYSVQVPLYDAISYMQKAVNFWRSVDKGLFLNPFNLQPTVRPPGIILMAYPFGLSPDFHGFFFRSVFLPILSIIGAIYIAAGLAQVKASGWRVAAMAFLFSSLPMFYWMDWNDERYINNGWGMADNFHAGIAAMAVAAILKSQMKKSRRWLLFGALLASFTLLVKPSGMMVMALTFLIWLMMIIFEWIQTLRLQRPVSSLRTYARSSGAIFLFSYTFVVVLSVFSGYFSAANFEFARKALAVMREVWVNTSFLPLFHLTSGEVMPLWMIGMSALLIHQVFVARKDDKDTLLKASVLLVAAIVTWISGAWYWLVVQSGASQIRYFYPFMLMGCICVVSAALYVWPRIGRTASFFMTVVCFLPALNMAALLAAGDSPSSRWQYMTGVSVSVGADREEVSQAYAFLKEIRKTKKDARIYFFANKMPTHIFVCVGIYEKMMRPDLASFSSVQPVDWARGFAVRIDELLDCEYILVHKYGDDYVKRDLSLMKLETFEVESRAFESWIFTQNDRSGLEIVSDGQKLRLLRIADRAALNRAIDEFISTHEWRPEFKAANRPMWGNNDVVKATAGKLVVEDIKFGGVYILHAMAINRVEQGIKIDVWWEELRHEEANNQRFLFFHLIDKSGKIIYNQQIELFPYTPSDKEKRRRHGTTTFNGVLSDSNLTSLAFGIYQPNGPFLMADKIMPSDWEGRRILIPLSAIPHTVRK